MKHGIKGEELQADEILMESISENGTRILSTACNGTIVIRPDKVEFSPNCPKGIAVFERIPSHHICG